MSDRSDPRRRAPATQGAGPAGAVEGNDALGWEARALAQVRPHVKELSGPAAAQAGWETDTITRLEDYFDRSEV
jgi:hypothetical protein